MGEGSGEGAATREGETNDEPFGEIIIEQIYFPGTDMGEAILIVGPRVGEGRIWTTISQCCSLRVQSF